MLSMAVDLGRVGREVDHVGEEHRDVVEEVGDCRLGVFLDLADNRRGQQIQQQLGDARFLAGT